MPKTWALWFHLEMHQQLLAQQKAMEQQAMQAEVLDTQQGKVGKINVGAEKRSPQAAASPLKSETNTQAMVR